MSDDGTYYIITDVKNADRLLVIPEEHEGKPVREIAERAFWHKADWLRQVILSDNLQKIGAEAFDGCYRVVSLTLGRGLTTVEGMLFQVPPREVYNRSALTTEQIFTFLPDYETNVYSDTEGTRYVTETDGYLVQEKNGKKVLLTYVGNETDLTLPAGITEIAGEAFYENRKITSVVMPDTVTEIGSGAFSWCMAMESIKLSSAVTKMGERTFMCCRKLTSIELPNGLKEIELEAFQSSALTSIVIPDNVTVIEKGAFDNCPLTSVTIGTGVTYIGTEAFSGCQFAEIRLPASLRSISQKAFEECENLTSVVFADPTGWTVNKEPADSAALADPATAATYLTETYVKNGFYKES